MSLVRCIEQKGKSIALPFFWGGRRLDARRALTLVEVLVVITIIGVLIALLLPAIQAARESARRTECRNHVRQVGLALHQHHAAKKYLPSGWRVEQSDGQPGWSWASQILPYLEQVTIEIPQGPPGHAIGHPANQQLRQKPIPLFLCPSDPSPKVFMLHEAGPPSPANSNPNPGGPGGGPPIDPPGPPMFEVARANYSGVFGTSVIETHPNQGDGTFFQNSRIRFAAIMDGLSNTLIVGERSSRLGNSAWIGAVPGAHRSMARVVGRSGRAPNDVLNDFSDFSSHHLVGAHFLVGDGSVRMINDEIDLEVYRGLTTRSAGESFTIPE